MWLIFRAQIWIVRILGHLRSDEYVIMWHDIILILFGPSQGPLRTDMNLHMSIAFWNKIRHIFESYLYRYDFMFYWFWTCHWQVVSNASFLLPVFCCQFTIASFLLPVFCCQFSTASYQNSNRDQYFEQKLKRNWMIRTLSHLKITCIYHHVTWHPSMSFWAISRYPPYIYFIKEEWFLTPKLLTPQNIGK